jgi:hypothetical protein
MRRAHPGHTQTHTRTQTLPAAQHVVRRGRGANEVRQRLTPPPTAANGLATAHWQPLALPRRPGLPSPRRTGLSRRHGAPRARGRRLSRTNRQRDGHGRLRPAGRRPPPALPTPDLNAPGSTHKGCRGFQPALLKPLTNKNSTSRASAPGSGAGSGGGSAPPGLPSPGGAARGGDRMATNWRPDSDRWQRLASARRGRSSRRRRSAGSPPAHPTSAHQVQIKGVSEFPAGPGQGG